MNKTKHFFTKKGEDEDASRRPSRKPCIEASRGAWQAVRTPVAEMCIIPAQEESHVPGHPLTVLRGCPFCTEPEPGNVMLLRSTECVGKAKERQPPSPKCPPPVPIPADEWRCQPWSTALRRSAAAGRRAPTGYSMAVGRLSLFNSKGTSLCKGHNASLQSWWCREAAMKVLRAGTSFLTWKLGDRAFKQVSGNCLWEIVGNFQPGICGNSANQTRLGSALF